MSKMDVKPQRPLRTAAPGNENILPGKEPGHLRPKSTTNLRTMAATGALNAPPKRTAFGDVSNTARNRVGDAIGKPVGREAVKARAKTITAPVNTREIRLEDKENREGVPIDGWSGTNAASKGTGNGSSSQSGAPAKPGSRASLAQPPQRNGATKKAAAVSHDRQEPKINVRPDGITPVDDLAALMAKPAKYPRHSKSQPLLRVEQQILRQAQGRLTVKPDNLDEGKEEDEIDDKATEAAFEDAVEQLARDAYDAAFRDALAEVEQASGKSGCHDEDDRALQPKALAEPPVASEPEEYWDEEEEPEYYEDQGYTTAHSYRSHGDNTTSGPTTMLAPNVTANVQDELDKAKAHVLSHQTEEELEEEAWDVSMVAEYGDEIFAYMRGLETRMLPNPHYMDTQSEIQWSMRSVLMDWVVQVHHRFCLLPETLFLTVNYIDRFLSVKVVSLGKLQLVGATALFVAAKYEEINCPSVQEIVYMVDSGYSVDEVLKAERYMLSMLHFELGWPGPMSFLRRISKADDYDLETRTLAKYFLEITIMDERFVSSPPSFLAAGAHCISRLFLGKGDWTPAHAHYSGYTLSQLKPLVKILFECCQYPRKHHGAIYDKYASAKYKESSTFVESKIASGVTLSQLYAAATAIESVDVYHAGAPFAARRNLIPIQG